MGNCQAIDAAAIVIEQPCGRVEKLYWPVNASEVMSTKPGHYVALLISISTTLCPNQNKPVRVTRVKLLRPTDTLLLGHVYRLITAQDVMKGLGAKKHGKMRKAMSETVETSVISEMDQENHHQVSRHEKERQGSTPLTNHSGATARPRTWQPSLHSISESAS